MDERCKICRNACKRLDSNDDPVHYQFCNLTCADAIAAVEKTVVDFGYSRLKNAAREHSLGNQLAMIFRCNSDDEHGSPIVVIAQASDITGGIDLWFRYCVEEDTCNKFGLVTELSELITKTLAELAKADQRPGVMASEKHI